MEPINPRLYKVQCNTASDTYETIFTSYEEAKKYEKEMWEIGGIYSSYLTFADHAVSGVVIWKPVLLN
jgi:hypothetical protein